MSTGDGLLLVDHAKEQVDEIAAVYQAGLEAQALPHGPNWCSTIATDCYRQSRQRAR